MLHNLDHILLSPSKLDPGQKADNRAIPPLKRHEVVEGKIIKSIPPYHSLLLIKGTQLVARTRVPLRPGDVVLFKVEQLAPECILKLVELRHESLAGVVDLLKGSGFQGFPYKEHDLKGLALRSLADAGAMKLLSGKGVGRFIDALEQLQLLNLSGLEEKGKLLFVIPMQWDDGFSFAQLLIDISARREHGEDEKDQNRVVNLSLFLDMSSLGPVLVDASVFQKVIKIDFCVCNEKTQSLFNNHTDHLVKQIERHGFSVQQVTCRLEERGHLAETSLVDAILDPEEHYISIVI